MATVSPLPIDVSQDAENVEYDIREYLSPGSPGASPNGDRLAWIVAAKIVEAAVDRLVTATTTQTTTLQTAINNQTTELKAVLDLIAADIDTIATDIDTIATNSTSIKTSQETVATKQTAIETYQKKLKELGEGVGIRSRGPYETWGNISTYKFLIEQGKILNQENAVSPEAYQQALAAIQTYVKLMEQYGKEF